MVNASTGVISTVAGNGVAAYAGDNGPASSASLNGPYNVVFDASGNFYISDHLNSRVRMVNASTGMISTVAGNGANAYSGDNGPASSASLYWPDELAFDSGHNLLISDTSNNSVRVLNASTGII